MKRSAKKTGGRSRLIAYIIAIAILGVGYYVRENGIELGGIELGGGSAPVSGGALPETAGTEYETLTGCRIVDNGGNDGDSFRVRHSGEEYTFRLYFVDTPETNDRYPDRIGHQARYFDDITPRETIQVGEDAKKFTLKLLRDKPFAILTRWEKVMKSYRYHGFVLVETAPGRTEYLSEILVRNGLARIYTLPTDLPDGTSKNKFKSHLQALEKKARAADTGAWGL